MGTGKSRLTPNSIKALAVGSVGMDGGGLRLKIGPTRGRGRWAFRIRKGNKTKEFGLGSYPDVGLAEARKKALEIRKQVAADGGFAEAEARNTLETVAGRFIDERIRPSLTSKEAMDNWEGSLRLHVFPSLGDLDVADISAAQIRETILPIWQSKNETARRIIGRLKRIFQWSIGLELRAGANPVDGIEDLLPVIKAQTAHHAAVGVTEAPKLYQAIAALETPASRCLAVLCLLALRSNEIRGLRWSEVDFDAALVRIPASRMKSRQPFRQPLPRQALDLIETMRGFNSDLVFPSQRDKVLSVNAFGVVLKKQLGRPDVTAHGWRSTFRQWCQQNQIAHNVSEGCLAHTERDKVVRAYARDDILDLRRDVLQQWANHLEAPA